MDIGTKTEATFITGDALTELGRLPDNSVDCCVTSPPYYGLRDYGIDGQLGLESTPDEYINNLVAVFREIKRVLKNDGTLWLNIADSYAGSGKGRNGDGSENLKTINLNSRGSKIGVIPKTTISAEIKPKDLIGIPWMLAFALRSDGWYLRSDIIWHKPNPMPESVKDRPTKCYEHIFLLAKSRRYYYDAESILEPAQYDGRKETLNKGSSKYKEIITPRNNPQNLHVAGKPHERWRFKDGQAVKNKRDVWTVSPHPFKGAHFATFPPPIDRAVYSCRVP